MNRFNGKTIPPQAIVQFKPLLYNLCLKYGVNTSIKRLKYYNLH